VVKQGNAAETILEQSRISRCDMIVMGTHGHSALAEALVGGTVHRVIRHSRLPVMVARLPDKEPS
jgi:nucleotide-binding universal stress UspA family protein